MMSANPAFPATPSAASASSAAATAPVSSASAASAVAAIAELFASHGHSDYVGEAVSQVEHGTQAAYHAVRAGFGGALARVAPPAAAGGGCGAEGEGEESGADGRPSVPRAALVAYSPGMPITAGDEVVVAALLHDVGHMLGLASDARRARGQQGVAEARPGATTAVPEPAFERMGDCGVMRHESIGGAWLSALGLPRRVCRLVERHVQAKRYLVWKDPGYRARLSEASATTLTYQGGPMGDEEALAFEGSDPDFRVILQMRGFDEAAKVPGARVPPLEAYLPLIGAMVAAGAAGPAAAEDSA